MITLSLAVVNAASRQRVFVKVCVFFHACTRVFSVSWAHVQQYQRVFTARLCSTNFVNEIEESEKGKHYSIFRTIKKLQKRPKQEEHRLFICILNLGPDFFRRFHKAQFPGP